MTSQRDETVSHISSDEMADDPIVVERHDEILGGPPVDDPEADDALARDTAADDGTPADDELATDRPAGDELSGDELSGDELARPRTRHRRRAARDWSRTRHLSWSPRILLWATRRSPAAQRRRTPRRPPRSPGCP